MVKHPQWLGVQIADVDYCGVVGKARSGFSLLHAKRGVADVKHGLFRVTAEFSADGEGVFEHPSGHVGAVCALELEVKKFPV